ncbi:MAG: hypothetical protein SGARI_006313, partial [Bacillariaceae sp.]
KAAEENVDAIQNAVQAQLLQYAVQQAAHQQAQQVAAAQHLVQQAAVAQQNQAVAAANDMNPAKKKRLKRQLPVTFLPSPNTVICVDEKDPQRPHIPGNKLLRDLGFQWLDDYMTVPQAIRELKDDSTDKFVSAVRRHKFKVVKKLVKMVNQLNSMAGFVHFERTTNRWWEVTDEGAWREAKNVITFCRDMKVEAEKNAVSARQMDSPFKGGDKKRKRSSESGKKKSSPKKRKKKRNKPGYALVDEDELEAAKASKKQEPARPGWYNCMACGQRRKEGGRHACPFESSNSDGEHAEALQISEPESSESEYEEDPAPEGFKAYQGGIRVFKQDDHYTAKLIVEPEEPATKAVDAPPKVDAAEQSSDDEEVEGTVDDEDEALIF